MLKTDYKNAQLDTSKNTKRKFNLINNADGTISFEDVTEYIESGDVFSANDINETNEAVNTANLIFSNMTATGWVADNTYTDFQFRCDIPCQGVTEDYFSEVVFNIAEAMGGEYAPISITGDGIVSIFSSVNNTITIPTIKCSQAV